MTYVVISRAHAYTRCISREENTCVTGSTIKSEKILSALEVENNGVIEKELREDDTNNLNENYNCSSLRYIHNSRSDSAQAICACKCRLCVWRWYWHLFFYHLSHLDGDGMRKSLKCSLILSEAILYNWHPVALPGRQPSYSGSFSSMLNSNRTNNSRGRSPICSSLLFSLYNKQISQYEQQLQWQTFQR